jgi:uncharacterized protein YqeY
LTVVTGPLRQQLQSDLRVAIKARDASRVAVLRTTLAAIANAEAVDADQPGKSVGLFGDVERVFLSEEDVRVITTNEREELAAAAAEMRGLGQVQHAAELEARTAVLDAYLSR